MRTIKKSCAVIFISTYVLFSTAVLAEDPELKIYTSYGLTLFGEPKYGPDFKHFDYVNPDAPKGGAYTFNWSNSFNSLNLFITLGTPPVGLNFITYDFLMVRSGDEPASIYGLVAETISYPDDYSWVEFKLRESARFHDGHPLTVEDVIFTMELLRSQGTPQFRNDYGNIEKAEQIGPHSVRFTFKEKNNRGIVYTMAQMPVLPKHYWEGRDFNKPTLDPPLSSGPYKVIKVDPGRSYTLERVKDYWAKDLPVHKGLNNFDTIHHVYYRDISVSFEAFMAGNGDLRWETLPHQWASGYDVPAVHDGRLIKEMLEFSGATFDAGLYFNLRLKKFQDPKVREAIAQAFDFNWVNKNIFYGQYARLRSHFEHTELANQGVPTGLELELLEPYRGQLDPRLFTQEYLPPDTDGSQASLRQNLRKAAMLLKDAGWTMKDGVMVSATGKPLEFELLLWDPFLERAIASFVANLKLLGIKANLRVVDTGEWSRRMENFDYEMTQGFNLPPPLSPGTEQRALWGSAAADINGSSNQIGVKNPIVDALIEKIVFAPDRAALVAATRAMDRVLCWNFYSIPTWYAPGVPVAFWNRFGRPEREPTWLRFLWFMSHWWVDPAKEARLEKLGGKKAK